MSDPKLLHELDWVEPSSNWQRMADVCRYRIIDRGCGEFSIIPLPLSAPKPRWIGIDPITARCVLIHIQQSPPEN
jgi:hypothetical protein